MGFSLKANAGVQAEYTKADLASAGTWFLSGT